MIRTEKIAKQRSSYLPISIVWVLKIAIAIAGFAWLGWWFVVGLGVAKLALWVTKICISCLVSVLVLAIIIVLIILIL